MYTFIKKKLDFELKEESCLLLRYYNVKLLSFKNCNAGPNYNGT